ncbi:hypothetical protein DIURU_005224 [Diutina rugosa]|uniref:Pro-apoptotic serine protease NMA111 n=1 Tax=Diutina rugosa TaxID=5481 RepID=A0A642UE91_DIURU|nr:uncharacterized protein DIURU_005224 [Diutina rugosa]KAA8897445.1 hypothetical protein DIURU_005224 [Diutina rugosa]
MTVSAPKRRSSDDEAPPAKRMNVANGGDHPDSSDMSDLSSDGESIYDMPPDRPSAQWLETIHKVVQAVVSIQFTHVAPFDTETAIVSEATGFIVDTERGIILTNRHVVGPGPLNAYAVLDNHEEVPLTSLYRDPIHDYGFLKYDPSSIKYSTVTPLKLKPEGAKVGTEIRVAGNDAGEKLSILSGTISKLDRNAPDYGNMMYNDFNTEYIQAAASASGGSSGSPVVDIDGDAVALQAGGSTEASTDFFLPLDRPKRALECIQQGLPITRGDIQVEWQLKPYDECRRLGLTADAEAEARERFPHRIGMLVAEIVLPDGPAYDHIKEGDILLEVNNTPISSFVQVDEILDANVGQQLQFVVQRSGQTLTQQITIGDLHKITPDRYVEVAGASFNALSYQIARCYCIPVTGVYINHAGGGFDSLQDRSGWILESVDYKPTPTLDALIEVMKSLPDSQRVPVTYRHVSDIHTELVRVIYLERHWCSTFRVAVRNDTTGLWDFTELQSAPPPAPPIEPQNAKFIDLNVSSPGRAALPRSLVQIRSHTPITVDSYPYARDFSYGVVVDAEHGYVLVSRKTVPHDMCDVFVVFAESIEVPATVAFLHPTLNYAIVKYDPSKVLADVRTPKFSTTPLKRGDKACFVGYTHNMRMVTDDDITVSAVSSINIPSNAVSPRYRGINMTTVVIDSKLVHESSSGLVTDADGTVRAIWLTYLGDTNCDSQDVLYKMGLDVTDVAAVIKSLNANTIPQHLRMIEAEFNPQNVLTARSRGVSQDWITRYEDGAEDQVQFFTVARVAAAAKGHTKAPLKVGDIVLSVNDQLVRSARDLTNMYTEHTLKFLVMRQRQELTLEVDTVDTHDLNTSKLVSWSGASLQAPHYAVRELMDKVPSEIYCTRMSTGSPAHQYGVATTSFITHVNDVATHDLDEFVAVVREIPDNTYVKLRAVTFDNVPFALSVKVNYHYFPTSQMRRTDDGKWVEDEIKPSK